MQCNASPRAGGGGCRDDGCSTQLLLVDATTGESPKTILFVRVLRSGLGTGRDGTSDGRAPAINGGRVGCLSPLLFPLDTPQVVCVATRMPPTPMPYHMAGGTNRRTPLHQAAPQRFRSDGGCCLPACEAHRVIGRVGGCDRFDQSGRARARGCGLQSLTGECVRVMARHMHGVGACWIMSR